MRVAILTFFMANIDRKTVEWQRRVVEKFNVSCHPHYQIPTVLSHAQSIDLWMHWPAAIYVLLDVDCVPLDKFALDTLIGYAKDGALAGNIQRSNHIDNGQHLFVAPSALAISAATFERLGRPSAEPTSRGDVCEEWTYRAERASVPVWFADVRSFEDKPLECDSWALKDGMRHYGLGTTFGNGHDMFYHRFQIRMPGQQEKFWAKCEALAA